VGIGSLPAFDVAWAIEALVAMYVAWHSRVEHSIVATVCRRPTATVC
jgi:hypothetical protein